MAAPISCVNPGRVNSAERKLPPVVELASINNIFKPDFCSVIAADNPLGPEPTTTTSKSTADLSILKVKHSYAGLIVPVYALSLITVSHREAFSALYIPFFALHLLFLQSPEQVEHLYLWPYCPNPLLLQCQDQHHDPL
jgi:hypothetical protein